MKRFCIKKAAALMIAFLLLIGALSACSESPLAHIEEVSAPTAVPAEADDPEEPAETAVPNFEENREQSESRDYLWLAQDGERIDPYKSFVCSSVYYASGTGYEADGAGLYDVSGVSAELPRVREGFEVVFGENCSLDMAIAYDANTFDRIKECLTLEEFIALLDETTGDIIADLVVSYRKESEGCSEHTVYSCAYYIMDPESDARTEPDDPSDYLKLLWNGETWSPCRNFLYGASFVDDGEGSGNMLHADGEAFFKPLSEMVTIDELPVVGSCFELLLGQGCEIKQVRIYDPETFENISAGLGSNALLELARDGLSDHIVEIIVRHEGEFIGSLGESEYKTYSFAFVVAPESPCAGTTVPTAAPKDTAAPFPAATPTPPPTVTPTQQPTATPTPRPTVQPTATPTPKPTATPTPRPTAQPTAEPTVVPDGDFIKTGFMKIMACGNLYTPTETLDYSKIYLDDIGGFIHGDGFWFGYYLADPDFVAALPRVPYDADFELKLEPGCRVYRIDVFDIESHDRLAHRISESALRQMLAEAENGLIVDIHVSSRGRYINGEYEYWGNSYGFIMGAD